MLGSSCTEDNFLRIDSEKWNNWVKGWEHFYVSQYTVESIWKAKLLSKRLVEPNQFYFKQDFMGDYAGLLMRCLAEK